MTSSIIEAIVSLLILQLGDNIYAKREKAHQVLTRLVPYASHHQFELALKDPDPEIGRRALMIYRPIFEKRMEVFGSSLLKSFPWFKIMDSSGNWSYFGMEMDMWRARAVEKWKLPFPDASDGEFQSYRAACKLWVIVQLQGRKSIEDIRNTLEALERYEKEWKDQNNRKPDDHR